MFESFIDSVSGPWWYPYLFLIAAVDVLFPIVPSETSVIAAGVLAATGDLFIALVIVLAAAGAVLGDNTSYWIGRKAGRRLVARFFAGERQKRIKWAESQIDERGGYLIVVGRFIPGGRTAVTLASGLLKMRWRRFIAFDVAAGLLWANFAALLGFFGGKAFEDEPLKAFVIAFGVALAVAGAIEVVRWLKRRGVIARS